MTPSKESERLDYLCNTIPALLGAISNEDFTYKPSRERWSKKEILGHLIDSAANNHHRFVRRQFEPFTLVPYDQLNWVRYNFYQQLPTQQLIEFWASYNRQLSQLIQHIPAENLLLSYESADGTIVSLAFLIEDYVAHLEHHLHQIIPTY